MDSMPRKQKLWPGLMAHWHTKGRKLNPVHEPFAQPICLQLRAPTVSGKPNFKVNSSPGFMVASAPSKLGQTAWDHQMQRSCMQWQLQPPRAMRKIVEKMQVETSTEVPTSLCCQCAKARKLSNSLRNLRFSSDCAAALVAQNCGGSVVAVHSI